MFYRAFICLFVFLLTACSTTATNNTSSLLEKDKQQITKILNIFDQQTQGSDEYLQHIENDIILMAHGLPEISGRDAYTQHIEQARTYGKTSIKHNIIDIYPYDDIVIARGSATGYFQGHNSTEQIPFKTKNLFIFKRIKDGKLSVWQIIFNMTP